VPTQNAVAGSCKRFGSLCRLNVANILHYKRKQTLTEDLITANTYQFAIPDITADIFFHDDDMMPVTLPLSTAITIANINKPKDALIKWNLKENVVNCGQQGRQDISTEAN
jgi:hypothetical protein